MTRARETRRARAQAREDLRIVLGWLTAVVVGAAIGIGIDTWINL